MEMVWTACDEPAATAEDTTPPEGLDAGDPSSAPSSSVVDTSKTFCWPFIFFNLSTLSSVPCRSSRILQYEG